MCAFSDYHEYSVRGESRSCSAVPPEIKITPPDKILSDVLHLVAVSLVTVLYVQESPEQVPVAHVT